MISGRIDIWDLNLVDNVDPLLKLGHSKKKRPHKPDVLCHTDAVLDCAWNRNLEHILASSSADTDVIMWDLETAKASSSLTEHTEKAGTSHIVPLRPTSAIYVRYNIPIVCMNNVTGERCCH